MGAASVLFPAEPRTFTGRRAVKIACRAAHVLCAGVLTGSYVFDVDGSMQATWFLATVASGSLILVLDLHESAAFLLQVRGLVVAVKLMVVAALPWLGSCQAWALCALVVVSVVFSHAPSRVRYRVLAGRGIVRGSESKG